MHSWQKIKQTRECTAKVRYATLHDAEESADFTNKYSSEAPALRAYRCIWCHGFHITSRPPRNEHEGDLL